MIEMYLIIVKRGKQFQKPKTFERHLNTILKRFKGNRISRSIFKLESLESLLEMCELANNHRTEDLIVYETKSRIKFPYHFTPRKEDIPEPEDTEETRYILPDQKVLSKEDFEEYTDKGVQKFLNYGKKHQK